MLAIIGDDVRFEATGPLFQAVGVDLTKIQGIDVGTALVILAEIGVDVSRFPTEKHFASWLRLCPTQDESNDSWGVWGEVCAWLTSECTNTSITPKSCCCPALGVHGECQIGDRPKSG